MGESGLSDQEKQSLLAKIDAYSGGDGKNVSHIVQQFAGRTSSKPKPKAEFKQDKKVKDASIQTAKVKEDKSEKPEESKKTSEKK